MSVSYGIVTAHGGTIEVVNTSPAGTTFRVTLPAVDEHASRNETGEAPPKVDAIVCDLRMPGLDGPAFHERLRRERPGLAARTMFITGDVIATGGRIGGIRQPVIAKPFTFEKLEETLVALMRGTSVATRVGWP